MSKYFIFGPVVLIVCLQVLPVWAQSGTYSRSQVGSAQKVLMGTIEDVQLIQIKGQAGVGGTVAGGVLGNQVGRAIGGGSGTKAARATGSVLGAGLGRRAQTRASSGQGLEIIVKLDNGERIGVVQEQDDVYSIGQRVRIMADRDGTHRVRKVTG